MRCTLPSTPHPARQGAVFLLKFFWKKKTLSDLMEAPEKKVPAETEAEWLEDDEVELLDASDVSGDIERADSRTREEWQKMEEVRGRIEDFGENVRVHFDMRKDLEKRPGDEPGEDMFLAHKETGLTGVFDGLGGEGKGNLASAKAAEMAPQRYVEARAGVFKDAGSLERMGQDMISKQADLAHSSERASLIEAGQRMWKATPDALKKEMLALYRAVELLNADVAKTGGKTTLTLGKTVAINGRSYEIVVNVGDSGAFKVRADGTARELTEEDSALDQALSMGLLKPEEAKNPDHVVAIGSSKIPVAKLRAGMYQALGGEIASPRVSVTEIRPGEKVVYLTDGVRDIPAFETDGRFDPAKAAESFSGQDGENLASILAGKSVAIERAQKTAWGIEAARAEINGTNPSAKKPKQDEKTVLVKEMIEDLSHLVEESAE